MLAIHKVVPDSKRVILHNPSPKGPLAVDVYASPGSKILAPLPGKVVHTSCPDTPSLPGCQIRGFLRLPGGGGLPFVLAHLQPGTFPPKGKIFKKGAILGKMELWEQHPNATHVHWAFRTPRDKIMPPPATIPVVKGFELCGLGSSLGPQKAARALDVQEIDAEDSEDFVQHGDLEVLDEEFEYDAEEFEQGDLEVLDKGSE